MVECLYFLHIPKTAGTSLIAYLDSRFPPETIFPYQVWPDYTRGPYFDRAEAAMDYYRLYRGHFGMGFANDTAKSPAIVTFLRDPRQHVLSMFNHALVDRDRGIALHPGIDDKTESLFDYLSQENIRPRMTNVQSRQLCSPICRADIGDQHRRTSGEWETPIAEPQALSGSLRLSVRSPSLESRSTLPSR